MTEGDRFACVDAAALTESERGSVVKLAIEALALGLEAGPFVAGSDEVRQALQLEYAMLEDEAFGCIFLTTRHRVIAKEVLFNGSIDRLKVYPRVVVRRALALNAAAVVCWHNHPSGNAQPSSGDVELTRILKDILEVVDMRLLDHVIVSRTGAVSMAEKGLV